MATAEITRPERSLITTSRQLADLTEKDRFVDTRSEASPRDLVERTVVLTARGKPVRFKYQDSGDPLPDWFVPVLRGFANLITLPDNWDGEGASSIDRGTIGRALAAIEQLLDRHASAPSVVPTPDSGLQIEWHRGHKDLEIEFRSNGRTEFYYFDDTTGEEHEGPVGPGFASLKKYLGRIW
jgi:hypothetical protein